MRILITGSREWTDVQTIIDALRAEILSAGSEKDDTVIVHGACPRGADALADAVGRQWGVTVETHPADWSQHGKKAGFLRNKHMVDLGADVLLAFIKDNSKGATHTVNLANAAGLRTVIYRA